MNAPRLVLNASVAGLYGALLLAAFLRLMHPGPSPADWLAGLLPVVLVYAAAAGLFWPLAYGAVRFFASHPLNVPRFSLRYVLSFHAVNGAVILGALLDTLWRDRKVIEPGARTQLKVLGAAVAVAWLYAVLVCVVPRLKRHDAVQASAAGLALAALLVPVLTPDLGRATPARAARGGAQANAWPIAARLVLLDFDGADLEDILTLQSAGRLPSFSRLRREGSYGRLGAFAPCDTAVVRTTLATGRLPYRNGVRGPWSRDLMGRRLGIQVVPRGIGFDLLMEPFMRRRPLSVADRRGPALWDIAALAGGVSVAAGWDVVLDTAGPAPPPGADLERRILSEFTETETPATDPAADEERVAELARSLAADEAVARALPAPGGSPGVVALAFPGIDRVAHRFLRYARPGDFGNVTEAEIDRWGSALERYYTRLDAWVGQALDARGPDGWLLVVSSYGMDPAPLRRRLGAELVGREATAGYHDDAPPGFLFALGPGVQAGESFGRASIADVVPTALYVLGMPIARDLDGSIVEQILGPGEILGRPAIVIDSYDAGP